MTTKKHVYYVLLAGLSFCTVNYVVTAVRPVVVPPQITQKPAPLFSDSNALKLYTAMQTGTTPTISIMPPVTSINALSTVGKTLLDYAASAPYWASTWMTLIGQAGGLTSSLLTTAQQLFPDPTAQICYGMMNLSYVAPQTSLLPTLQMLESKHL